MIRQLPLRGWVVAACLAAAGCGPTNLSGPTGVVVSAGPNVSTPVASAPAVETPAAQPVGSPVQPVAAAAEPQAPPVQAGNDAPKPPTKQRPPADRQPRRPGDAEKITFEDLNLGMQADVAFRPIMTEGSRAKELEGQRVSIIGYMHKAQLSTNAVKEFVLLKNTECKFGPGGQADHLARVYLKPGTTTKLTNLPIKVVGTLEIEAIDVDGITWSIYDLKDATTEVAK